ncbi:MAG: thiaminase II [Dehalococcoidia bacterium]
MGFSDELKNACADDWRKAHEDHPFIHAMGDGTLSLDQFQYFMRQDYLYLVDYCRVLAVACAKCPDLESMGWWARLLDETLNQEMALHRSFCSDFGITEQELESTEPTPATVAYTDHLLRVAYEEGIGAIAAAILPCQWGYDQVGRSLAARLTAPEGSFHVRWVAGYNIPEYQQLTEWLRGFVDILGDGASPRVRERMVEVFRASTRYEYLFWDAAWRLEPWRD